MKKKKVLRNSAKAIIIQDGQLLVIQKKDGEADYCVLPGGGQKKGENLHETLKREIAEEIGANIQVGKLLHVREYVSENHGFAQPDRKFRQVEFFFECELLGEYQPNNGALPDTRQEMVRWVELENLENVNFYPYCLHPILNNLKNDQYPVYLGECN